MPATRVSEYNAELFDRISLNNITDDLKVMLPALMERTQADSVVVTGKSGLAVGFALLTKLDFPLVVVRKAEEMKSTHGFAIEAGRGTYMSRWLLLDDFVCTGSTLRRVEATIAANTPPGETVPYCVGVVEYIQPVGSATPSANLGVPNYGTRGARPPVKSKRRAHLD